jgi:exosortase
VEQKTSLDVWQDILSHWVVRFLFFFLVLSSLGVFVFGSSLHTVFTAVIQRNDSSHGVFVPFLSAYFLWIKFHTLKGLKPEVSPLPAGILFISGILLFYLGSATIFSHFFSVLSFLFLAGALILLLFGTSVFRVTAFPLFFLAAMIPLPPDVYNQIAEWMRQVNTLAAVAVTKAFGVPLFREEFHIYLPEVNLFISDGCSGIRYLLSYFTFSLVYAFLFKQGIVIRLLVVLGSIPLAVIGGISRLSVIFLSAHYISPVMAEDRPHIILSWAVFFFWLVIAVGIDQYLSRDRGGGSNKNLQERLSCISSKR